MISNCYKIGRLGKAHGVKGEVTFQFDDDIFDRVDADYVLLSLDGILVPFFFEEYRFRSDTTAIVKFEGVDTQERARELTNTEVYFPNNLAEDQPPTLAFLVGFTIIDDRSRQPVGVIADIDDQTANILFCLEDGRLIPATDELITQIDQPNRQIIMNLPEGLLDI